MSRFSYGEYIFQQLVTTDFIQKKLTYILISLATNLIQLHLVAILCILFSFGPVIDFFLQIIISVVLSLNIEYTYQAVKKYRRQFHSLTLYLIKHYSIENYWRWKKIIVLSTCAYGCILLLLMQITNRLIFIYILQYACCFLIREQFEQKGVYQLIKNYREKPTIKRESKDPIKDFLIESYVSYPTTPTNPTPTRLINAGHSGSIVKNATDSRPRNYGIVKRR